MVCLQSSKLRQEDNFVSWEERISEDKSVVSTDTHTQKKPNNHRLDCPEIQLLCISTSDLYQPMSALGGITEVKICRWKGFAIAFLVLYQKYYSCANQMSHIDHLQKCHSAIICWFSLACLY